MFGFALYALPNFRIKKNLLKIFSARNAINITWIYTFGSGRRVQFYAEFFFSLLHLSLYFRNRRRRNAPRQFYLFIHLHAYVSGYSLFVRTRQSVSHIQSRASSQDIHKIQIKSHTAYDFELEMTRRQHESLFRNIYDLQLLEIEFLYCYY